MNSFNYLILRSRHSFRLNFLLLLIVLVSSSSCFRKEKQDSQIQSPSVVVKKPAVAISADSLKNEYMEMAIMYHQISGEYKAQCYQAYNFAKILLDKDLADKSIDKNRAVVLDIDETVLDNSPYQAAMVLGNFNYPVKWDEWCNKASAEAVPGVAEFLNYAKMNGVSIYYITNRKDEFKLVTIENLKKLGLPSADVEHVLTRGTELSKESRRVQVLQKHHISLLFGDNLTDFSALFDDKSNKDRIALTDQVRKEFGKKFVVIPNSMYGDWETALYGGKKNLPDSIKKEIRLKSLKGF